LAASKACVLLKFNDTMNKVSNLDYTIVYCLVY
jgi:hypothetical protein